MNSLDRDIADKEKELKILKNKRSILKKITKAKTIKCYGFKGSGCGRNLPISDLTCVDKYWYESPWGCTGGDTWHHGESYFTCPKCGVRNRASYNPDFDILEDRKFDLIRLKFKNYEKDYDR